MFLESKEGPANKAAVIPAASPVVHSCGCSRIQEFANHDIDIDLPATSRLENASTVSARYGM